MRPGPSRQSVVELQQAPLVSLSPLRCVAPVVAVQVCQGEPNPQAVLCWGVPVCQDAQEQGAPGTPARQDVLSPAMRYQGD